MARKGRTDRGLLSKIDVRGKTVWYVRLWHQGKERRFGTFKSKTEARVFYEKAKQEQRIGRFFPEQYQRGGYELVSEAIESYMRTITVKKPSTIRAEHYFRQWWMRFFEGQRLNAISTSRLDEARQKLLRDGLTPARVNRYMAWLRHLLNTAVRDGKITSNPASKLRMYKEPKGRMRFLSPDEEERLYKSLGQPYASWARLATLTGLRQDEQFSLRWSNVDLDRGIITLPTTKAGGVQYVYLNEEAKQILRHLDSWQRSVWVFPSENPLTHMDARNFYARIWTVAVQKAGIEWATWHDLRHTFASRLAMDGHSDTTIAALLRHSTTVLVKRYAHLSPSHLKGALEGLAGFGK
jgi:integrase